MTTQEVGSAVTVGPDPAGLLLVGLAALLFFWGPLMKGR
jgi:hypothetical protein